MLAIPAKKFKGIILTSNGVHDAVSAKKIAEPLKDMLEVTSLQGIRVAYIANAADTYRFKFHIHRSIKVWLDMHVDLHIVDLDAPLTHIRKELQQAQVLYVEGGNTFHLLYHFRKSKLDKEIHNYLHLVYIGSSAGSIIAGPNILIAALAGDKNLEIDQPDLRGLAIVPFIVWPHHRAHFSWQAFFSMPGRGQHRMLFFNKVVPLRDGEIITLSNKYRFKKF